MRPARLALLAALCACAAPPTTAAPAPPAQAPAAPSASSSAFEPVPAPPPPPRLRVPSPYAVVARADASFQLRLVPVPGGAFIVARPPPGASLQFAMIEGDEARILPDFGAGLPAIPASGYMDIAGMSRGPDGAWWAQLDRSDDGDIRSEFWKHGERWALVESASPGETGLSFSMASRGDQMLALGHGSISTVPFFMALEPARSARVPRFARTSKKPPGCPGRISFVAGFRAFAGGEALALGFSCATSFLQIERWRAGSERSEVSEVKEVSLRESSTVDIVSLDEVVLHQSFSTKSPRGDLRRLRLRRSGGVWRVKDEGGSSLPDEEAASIAATKALREAGGGVVLQWQAGGEFYWLVDFPGQGAPTERVLIRQSPVRTAVEWQP